MRRESPVNTKMLSFCINDSHLGGVIDLNIIPPSTKQNSITKDIGMYFIYLFDNIFNVVRFVIYTEKTTMMIGNINNSNQSVAFKDIVDINPTRAECAVARINNIIGVATQKPMIAATALIFPTMNCI